MKKPDYKSKWIKVIRLFLNITRLIKQPDQKYYGLAVEPPGVVVELPDVVDELPGVVVELPGVVLPVELDGRLVDVPERGVVDDPLGYVVVGCAVLPGVVD